MSGQSSSLAYTVQKSWRTSSDGYAASLYKRKFPVARLAFDLLNVIAPVSQLFEYEGASAALTLERVREPRLLTGLLRVHGVDLGNPG